MPCAVSCQCVGSATTITTRTPTAAACARPWAMPIPATRPTCIRRSDMATHLRHGRKKLLFAIVLVALAIAAGLLYQHTVAFADRPIVLDQAARTLVVDRGDGLDAVLRKLRALGVHQGHD